MYHCSPHSRKKIPSTTQSDRAVGITCLPRHCYIATIGSDNKAPLRIRPAEMFCSTICQQMEIWLLAFLDFIEALNRRSANSCATTEKDLCSSFSPFRNGTSAARHLTPKRNMLRHEKLYSSATPSAWNATKFSFNDSPCRDAKSTVLLRFYRFRMDRRGLTP